MDFRRDVPGVCDIVRVTSEDFIAESRVVGRSLTSDSGMEELSLSCGRVVRRNKNDADWRTWFSMEDIGRTGATKCQLEVIFKS